MMDIERAAAELAERACLSAIRNDLSPDEAALRLIAQYEDSKGEFTPDKQRTMKQITLAAVMLITGRG